MSTRRRGVASGATSGWQIEGIGGRMERDNIYGLAGINLITNRPNERIWVESTANHFEVYYVREPGGGAIDITLDGVTVLDAPLSLAAHGTATEYFSFDSPADTSHRLEVRTLRAGKSRILGIVAERLVPGVSYDVFGINGARISRLMTWNATTFVAELGQRKPDLVILAYGTNEIADPDWTPASYRRLLKSVIQRIRSAAPQASIMLFAPPDRADLPLAGERMPAMIETQRAVARLGPGRSRAPDAAGIRSAGQCLLQGPRARFRRTDTQDSLANHTIDLSKQVSRRKPLPHRVREPKECV
jgi:hypothetical protein